MREHRKSFAAIALTLLMSVILLATINPNIAGVKAQGQATITVVDSIGGTTDPAGPGTYTYAGDTTVTLTATPGDGFVFLYWIVSSSAGSNIDSDNPLAISVSAGDAWGVQAVFQPTDVASPGYIPPIDTTADAIVVVLPATGGTTDPAPGTYALANATQLTLTAIPDSGWQFVHWVISGGPMTGHGGSPFTATPTDNPYDVSHGYGYTYDYQPVFIPIGSTAPTPSPGSTGGLSTGDTIIIVLAAVIG